MKLMSLLNVIDDQESVLVWDDNASIDVPPLFKGKVNGCKCHKSIGNGIVKMIFEGDILEVDVREYEEAPKEEWYLGSKRVSTGRKIKALWSVEYKEHICRGNGFYVYGKDRRFNTTLTQSTIFNSNPVVIGNIHDNPELLNGGE